MVESKHAWDTVGLLGPMITIVAFILAFGLTAALLPHLRRFALAMPNARSSHRAATPQGGGIAVVAATVFVSAVAICTSASAGVQDTSLVFGATALLAVIGLVDDLRELGLASRLFAQSVAVAAILVALPADARIVSLLPFWLERGLLFIGGLWFVNAVNFMDGLDWMIVAEMVPVTVGIALIGALGALPAQALVVALALCGALLGFAPFNRPVARLFLGDVGSLPIGLLLIWLLFVVASSGHIAAALLLPLYFVGDASMTLFRRVYARERVWEAHRTHFYQRARDNGFTNMEVVGRVFAVNCGLVALAAMSIVTTSRVGIASEVALGLALVGCLMASFVRRP
jgi:UDP-N-acetylmuramyl pentapeptide phosphotransferase/UDP-N-acetylglucosamine-1-phosphate transferase